MKWKNHRGYSPFRILANENESIQQPFKFVGQFGVMTEPNGFYYMRARYYDTEVGRFISEDPIGFDGGDVNLYAYVGNNPILLIDPFGLRENSGSINYEQVLSNTRDYSGTLAAGLALSGIEPAAGVMGLTALGSEAARILLYSKTPYVDTAKAGVQQITKIDNVMLNEAKNIAINSAVDYMKAGNTRSGSYSPYGYPSSNSVLNCHAR